MVQTKADSVPSTYRKLVASCAPRKVFGSFTSAINSPSPSSHSEHVLCNLITQMMKKNRT
ncbi:PCNA-associated factor-like [Thomomys bottae]